MIHLSLYFEEIICVIKCPTAAYKTKLREIFALTLSKIFSIVYFSLVSSFATLGYLYQEYNTLEITTDIQWIKTRVCFFILLTAEQ